MPIRIAKPLETLPAVAGRSFLAPFMADVRHPKWRARNGNSFMQELRQ